MAKKKAVNDADYLRRLAQAEAGAYYEPPTQHKDYGSTLPGITRKSGIYRTKSPSMSFQELEKFKAEDLRDNDNLIRNFAEDYENYKQDVDLMNKGGGSASQSVINQNISRMNEKYGPDWYERLVPKAEKLKKLTRGAKDAYLGSYSNVGSKRVIPDVRLSNEQELGREKSRAEAAANIIKGANPKKGSDSSLIPGQTPEQVSNDKTRISDMIKAGMGAANKLFPPNRPSGKGLQTPSAINTDYDKAGSFRFPDLYKPEYEKKQGELVQQQADKITRLLAGKDPEVVKRFLARSDPEVAKAYYEKMKTKSPVENKLPADTGGKASDLPPYEPAPGQTPKQTDVDTWGSNTPEPKGGYSNIPQFVGDLYHKADLPRPAPTDAEVEADNAMALRRDRIIASGERRREQAFSNIGQKLKSLMPTFDSQDAEASGQPGPKTLEMDTSVGGMSPRRLPYGDDRLSSLPMHGGRTVPASGPQRSPQLLVDPAAAAMAEQVDPQEGVSKLETAASAVDNLVNRSGAQGVDMYGVIEELTGIYRWLSSGLGTDVAKKQFETLMQHSGLTGGPEPLQAPYLKKR